MKYQPLGGEDGAEPLADKRATQSLENGDIYRQFKQALFRGWAALAEVGWGHWFIAIVLIIIGLRLGHAIEERNYAESWRYRIYQFVGSLSPRQTAHAKRTALVIIGDEEYWKGDLARRFPIKRDYLGELVRRLAQAGALAVAIDFDLRAQTQDGTVIEHEDYHVERRQLLETIRDTPQSCKIILPRTIDFDHKSEEYKSEAAIYDGFDFERRPINSGYVELPFDVRQVPMTLQLSNGDTLDSFAVAIVRAIDRLAVEEAQLEGKNRFPYGTFLDGKAFEHLSAEVVRTGPIEDVRQVVEGKIVIIGGQWHARGYHRGYVIDTHLSPVGAISGPVLHANYVEALLDSRTIARLNKHVAHVLEGAFAALVAIVFAIRVSKVNKLKLIASLTVVICMLGFFLWHNLGIFFEFFIPLVLLTGHAAVEQVLEWRGVALHSHHQ